MSPTPSTSPNPRPSGLPSEEDLEASPLATIDREALNELFTRDPENLTIKDIKSIVPYYRKRYAAFRLSEIEKARKAKEPKKKKGKKPVPGADQIDLDLLG